jgi:uncharacterized OsmC-like protein
MNKAMKISASLKSNINHHDVVVQTVGIAKGKNISTKSSGLKSSVNSAEGLLLSFANCFSNDLYREAGNRNISISNMEVIFSGEFGAEGEARNKFTYRANVMSDAPSSEIHELIHYTDQKGEIQNTLRKGVAITLID